MKKFILLLATAFLGACTFGGEESEVTVAGQITKVDASEEMIWIDTRFLYIEEPANFAVGDIVRITFTDLSLEDSWNPDDFKVTNVEHLDKDLYSDLRETAWVSLPVEIKKSTTTSKSSAEVEDGFSNAGDPNVELKDEKMDNRFVWMVSYNVPGKIQPYKVLIDQKTLEVLGLKKPDS